MKIHSPFIVLVIDVLHCVSYWLIYLVYWFSDFSTFAWQQFFHQPGSLHCCQQIAAPLLACIQQLLLTERLCSCCKSIYIKRRKKERGTRPWTACHYHLVSWSLDGLQQALQSIQSWIALLFCRLHCCNWWRPKLLKLKINKWHNR